MSPRAVIPRLIETDEFPFEFLSRLAERESWRKDIHRPIYHVHKWWAKRLGSVFRGILLGCALPEGSRLEEEFYRIHDFGEKAVLDPFMGSGTTVGEAHKLGFSVYGRDINPVACNAVKVALGPLDRDGLQRAFDELSRSVGERIRPLYRSKDTEGRPCEALYYFWVMLADCLVCRAPVPLFPSWVFARNAYPDRKPEVRALCPKCGDVFPARHSERTVGCRRCGARFDPDDAPARGTKARCFDCGADFSIIEALGGRRPRYRLYAKLVLRSDGSKEYLPTDEADQAAYEQCTRRLLDASSGGGLPLPALRLEPGYNTKQAMSYGFLAWRDFFNDRQLLALSMLRRAIAAVPDRSARDALLVLFSGVLEFNNMFASYKGEGTGAVRHMFSHHILKPERTPIEANVWGTPKSSGSFSNLFRARLMRALDYRETPVEIDSERAQPGRLASPPFSGEVRRWTTEGAVKSRAIHLSCGDSAYTGLPDRSVDLVVTDPPFFDNVHYSELADFFHAWQRVESPNGGASTRNPREVQDSDVGRFSTKLREVLSECGRVLKDDGLLVFTYHHSREEGWSAVAEAVLGAGFYFVNAQPVKSEMSVAAPKAQAKEPIQLDMILVCRKQPKRFTPDALLSRHDAVAAAESKIQRLANAGFKLSRNDRKVVMMGSLLLTLGRDADFWNLQDSLGTIG